MKTALFLGSCAVAAWLVGGCGGGATSEVSAALRRGELDLALRLYDAQGGRDPGSLAAIAEATLEREARSRDPRRSGQAVSALRQSGTAAEPLLRRLAEDESDAPLRAQALALLAQLGDEWARGELRDQPAAAGPDLEAAAVLALDPETDLEQLLGLLDSPAAAVRRAAVQRLLRAQQASETQRALARCARHDPERAVRIGALSALARQGAPALLAIEDRLTDPEPEVRAGAAVALVTADYTRALERLAPLLGGEPTPEAIESARALLAADPGRAPAAARALLERTLEHTDAALRGRAAVALMSLRDARLANAAAARAAREPLRGVKLCLALSLPPANPARGQLLAGLMAERDVVSSQAAAELARAGAAAALAKLRELLTAGAPAVRRTAARALAHDLGRAHDARAALRDADASVRIAAAAAILEASVRQSAGRAA